MSGSEAVDAIAHERSRYGYVGRSLVASAALGEQSESKQTQKRSVGVGADGVDGINQTCGVDITENQDKQHESGTHHDVHYAARCGVGRTTQDVDATTGGERRKGRVGAAK